jgi:hypothetical protein
LWRRPRPKLGCGAKERRRSMNLNVPYPVHNTPAGAGNFSLYHRIQNGSGAYLASYPIDTRGLFLWW